MTKQVRCAHWYIDGTVVMEVTNCFLVGFEAGSIGDNSCLVLQNWSNACGVEVMGSKDKPTTAALLNG